MWLGRRWEGWGWVGSAGWRQGAGSARHPRLLHLRESCTLTSCLLHRGPTLQGLEPDTICYNTLIACMERCNQPDRALYVFEQMMVRRQRMDGGCQLPAETLGSGMALRAGSI